MQDRQKMNEIEREEQFETLCNVISQKRRDAVTARKDSGIEELWLACEEAYLGIDDANRHEFSRAKWAKPTSMQGPVTTEDAYRKNDPRSTAYVRLTSRYVDAGAAKLVEILLPPDDKAFKFSPTPIAEMVNDKEDQRPAIGPNGQPIMKPIAAAAGQMSGQPAPQPGIVAPTIQPNATAAPIPPQMASPSAAPIEPQPGQAAMVAPLTISDVAKQVMDEAQACADRAEKRIYDWMIECNWRAENRKVIHDSARIGVGVLKGPVPEIKRNQSAQKMPGGLKLEFIEKTSPAFKWVDPWNVFPDGACGENIHNGDHIFERDYLAQRQLRDLKKQKGYIRDKIDKIIHEGPEKSVADDKLTESNNPAEKKHKNRFTVWYYYGTLTRKEMELAQAHGLDALDENVKEVYCIVTMVNDTIIRATINPLDSGKFPYYAMPWTRRAGSWAGVGIAEQISMPQRLINAATRAMLNNAGLSAGPQIVIDRGSIEPAQQGDWTIRPNKLWFKSPDAPNPLDDVRKAMMSIEIPNVGPEMMANIEYAMKLAEESTNIPLISQGQTGPTTPETLGAVQLQNNNANTLLRSIGYSYDDYVTEPAVHAAYEWLLLDPDVPEDEKGDWDINAHGSVAMVERAIQDQTLAQMGEMVMNPAFGIDPKKWFEEWMKSKRMNPKLMQYTEEEQQKIAQTPPPEVPQITVAKIKSETDIKVEQMKLQGHAQASPDAEQQAAPDNSLQVAQLKAETELKKIEMQQQFAMRELQTKADEAERQRQHDLQMRQIDLQIKQMEMQQKTQEQQTQIQADAQARIDDSKVELANATITDQTKRELAQQETELALTLDETARDHEVKMNPPSLIKDEISTDATP